MGKLRLDAMDMDVDLSSLRGAGGRKTAGVVPASPPSGKSVFRPASPLIDTTFTPAAALAPVPERVVKDSFTFPPEEHALLEDLVTRSLRSGRRLGKSAILRAGLKLLAQLDDDAFTQALSGIEEVRRGPRRR